MFSFKDAERGKVTVSQTVARTRDMMPKTSGESMKCGLSHAQPPAPAQIIDMSSPSTSGSPCRSNMDGKGQRPQRPSVLRQAFQTPSRQLSENKKAIPICEGEVDGCCFPQTPSPPSSLGQSHRETPSMSDVQTQSSIEARICESISGGGSALFVSGLCRWPGCEALSTDFPSFLKHLHSEHSHGERSVAQCRIQQDIVQCLESQLILEKQKLIAMQLHLHLSEHKHSALGSSSEWPYSLPLFLPQPQGADGEDRGQQWCMRQLEELSQQGYRAASAGNVLSDFVPSMEYYKYKNIRPPYTYAYLIRWSIMESLDKQRTLNEIYNWFTSMFFYFRHNTATWKNAVRHNLSLHKCFVRVEGGKGAVWTVDETEYQRRKGQKYHRDCPVKWFSSYSHYCS